MSEIGHIVSSLLQLAQKLRDDGSKHVQKSDLDDELGKKNAGKNLQESIGYKCDETSQLLRAGNTLTGRGMHEGSLARLWHCRGYE